jgi:hypothetical protein
MYKALKNFNYMGRTYFVGDTMSDEIGEGLGSRVEYVMNSEATVSNIKTNVIEKKGIKARNKAILKSK